jgi:predicted RNase H-like nuclease (RuvC/YqgF family)
MTEEIIMFNKSDVESLEEAIKRLEQENKELKAYKDVNEDFKKAWDELNEKYKQLRSALEEIKKMVTNPYPGKPRDVLNIINEVLK